MNAEVQQLLLDAGLLLLVGMAVVFLFLSLLIGAVSLISKVCRRFPEAVSHVTTAATPRKPNVAAGISAAEVAAISAAIHQHRNSK